MNLTHKFKRTGILLALIGITGIISGTDYKLNHVDPPMWWTGMYNPELMLMLQGNKNSIQAWLKNRESSLMILNRLATPEKSMSL